MQDYKAYCSSEQEENSGYVEFASDASDRFSLVKAAILQQAEDRGLSQEEVDEYLQYDDWTIEDIQFGGKPMVLAKYVPSHQGPSTEYWLIEKLQD